MVVVEEMAALATAEEASASVVVVEVAALAAAAVEASTAASVEVDQATALVALNGVGGHDVGGHGVGGSIEEVETARALLLPVTVSGEITLQVPPSRYLHTIVDTKRSLVSYPP